MLSARLTSLFSEIIEWQHLRLYDLSQETTQELYYMKYSPSLFYDKPRVHAMLCNYQLRR